MVRTCHWCHGHSEDYKQANLKYDWVRHIFDCKPRRPINTADYLASAVNQNLLPEHPQTCEDYGFNHVLTGLKRLTQDRVNEEIGMRPSVSVDYGFVNCRNASERRQLKRVYKAFFEKHDGDPLALHEAAIKGNLHGFLSGIVQGLRDPKFQHLMKNPYPL